MFFLVGIGLKPEHLSLEALEALKSCSKIFLDSYTSNYTEGSTEQLERIIGKKIVALDRKGIEEDFAGVLGGARKENVALLVFGNALTATTHIQLLLDAKQKKVPFKVVQGISLQNLLPETGLDAYKFGRIVTIVKPRKNFAPESFFEQIQKNSKAGLHTLCLLDIDDEKKYFMAVKEALEIIEKIARKRKSGLLEKSLLVGLFALGSEKQKIVFGNLVQLKQTHFNLFPQSLIVCAKLNDKEKEAMVALHD